MRDQHDGPSARGDAAADVEQGCDFIRQQHRGRLVQQEQRRAPDQAFDDLDALPFADRKVLDLGIGIERQAVFDREFLQLLGALFPFEHAALAAEQHVVDDCHVGHQAEMLVHHGDAVGEGVRGAGRLERGAAIAHDAAIGAVNPENQVAQSGFAGAVFTEDAVNFAGPDVERHVRQRGKAAEPLCNRL